jgi:hypothetical protein
MAEVLTALKMLMLASLVVMLKCLLLPTGPLGIAMHKTNTKKVKVCFMNRFALLDRQLMCCLRYKLKSFDLSLKFTFLPELYYKDEEEVMRLSITAVYMNAVLSQQKPFEIKVWLPITVNDDDESTQQANSPLKMTAFWGIVPCSLVKIDKTFQRCILPPSSGYTSLKRWSTSTRLHGTISQKTVIFVLATVRILTLKQSLNSYEWGQSKLQAVSLYHIRSSIWVSKDSINNAKSCCNYNCTQKFEECMSKFVLNHLN